MITCLGDVFRPQAGVATVQLLRKLGMEVDFPAGQTCCGQPFFNSGYSLYSQQVARHTIKVFEDSEIVVTPSGSCAAMIKLEYPDLFSDDPHWHDRAVALAQRTHELTDFLVNVAKTVELGAAYRGRVSYHYACHLRGLGLKEEAIELIKAVAGVEFVPIANPHDCCGFGGSFAVRFAELSGGIVQDKVQQILGAKPDLLVSTDTGCLMNISGRLHRIGSAIPCVHLSELLAGLEPATLT